METITVYLGCLLVFARYWLIAVLFCWDPLALLLTSFIVMWWSNVVSMLGVISQQAQFLMFFTFLMNDYSFLSRHHVLQVFKLCCLIRSSKSSRYLSVVLDLPGSSLSQKAVDDCVRMVQSYVLNPSYAPKLFFTGLTLAAVRMQSRMRAYSASVCDW